MNKQRLSILWVAVILILFLSLSGATYAWFLDRDSSDKDMQMGVVDIDLGTSSQFDITSANPMIDFNIKNTSNIDYFLRMGYTLVFKDASGNDLPQDTPDDLIIIKLTHLKVGTQNVNLGTGSVTTYNSYGYKKQGIEMLNGSNKYIVFSSEEPNVGGRLQISFNTSKYPDYFSGNKPKNKLYITLIPESVQATKKALASTNMANAGWNAAKVDEQASTVVNDDVIK